MKEELFEKSTCKTCRVYRDTEMSNSRNLFFFLVLRHLKSFEKLQKSSWPCREEKKIKRKSLFCVSQLHQSTEAGSNQNTRMWGPKMKKPNQSHFSFSSSLSTRASKTGRASHRNIFFPFCFLCPVMFWPLKTVVSNTWSQCKTFKLEG